VLELLTAFAREVDLRSARLHGIGAFVNAELGFYDFDRKDYDRLRVDEETEVLSLLGNLSMTEEGPRAHAHATLSKRDGSAVGGHLFEGHVGATLEVFLVEVPVELRRALDEGTGLPLLEL
jgi:predicted DNA-binding protein with PD1-like motif